MHRQPTTPAPKLATNQRAAQRVQARTPARPCEWCSVEFRPWPRSQGRFCSRKHAGLARQRSKEASFTRFLPAGLAKDVCHEWRGGRDKDGYGFFRADGDNRPMKAHQFALQRAGVARPQGGIALHACDNPPCVNPAHLRWGTSAENTHDMMSRDRQKARPTPAI